jgi:hypothetical protein
MAKKKKKEDEEEAPAFKFPEFDEKEYLRDEMRDAKAVIAATLLGIPMAVGAAALTGFVHPTAGIVLGLAGFVVMFYLFRFLLKDISGFKIKHWLMCAGGYFFTFLAAWVIFINPPFMDLAGPVIEDVQYSTDYLVWTEVTGAVDMPYNATFTVRASVTDNVGLSAPPTITLGPDSSAMTPVPGLRGQYEAIMHGTGRVTITASDAEGQETEFSFDTY